MKKQRVVIDKGPAGVLIQVGNNNVEADSLERALPLVEQLEAQQLREEDEE